MVPAAGSATLERAVSDDVFLKFDYEERDLADAMRLRMTSGFRGRFDLLLGVVVCVIGAAVARAFAPDWVWRLIAVLLGLAVVVIAALVFAALRVAPRVMFRRSSSSSMSIDASEEGITITVGQRYATIKWRDCVRMESDARTHIVYHGAKGFLVIPRRAFRNEKQDEAFRSLALRFVHDPEDE